MEEEVPMSMIVLEAHQAAVVAAILAEEGVVSPPCWRVEVKVYGMEVVLATA